VSVIRLTHHPPHIHQRPRDPAQAFLARAIRERRPAVPEEHVIGIWLRELHPERHFTARGGEDVRVLDAGRRNRHDGPDFLDAIVVIDGVLRRGSIEVHVRESDWHRHRHHLNARYDDVILHVCLYAENRGAGGPPLVVLSTQMQEPLRGAWARARQSRSPLRCRSGFERPDPQRADAMITLAAAERFNRKRARLEVRWERLAEDMPSADAFRQAVYEAFARAAGYGGNEDGFERLARAVPLRELSVARPAVRQELLLSTAHDWNVSGVLPGNRPRPRMRWLADWAPQIDRPAWWRALFTVIDEGVASPASFAPLFASRVRTGSPGPERMFEFAVNVLAPSVHLYARAKGRDRLARAAAALFFGLSPSPENRHTRIVTRALELTCDHAVRQQGMIELYTGFCTPGRCGDCLLGKPGRG